MDIKTKNKIAYIGNFVKRQTPIWQRQYKSFAGAHVGCKTKKNRILNYYTIVFHVFSKQNTEDISEEDLIPKYFEVECGSQKYKIPTDVVETGGLNFLNEFIQPSEGVFPMRVRTNVGSIGFFFESLNRKYLYACSNMHVMAPDLLAKGQTTFFNPINRQNQPDIALFDQDMQIPAYLEKAIFGSIDVAIARIDDRTKIDNRIPNNGIPLGIREITIPRHRFFPIRKVGISTSETNGRIIGMEGTIPTQIPNVSLHNIIVAEIYSDFGDSGSPVFDRDMNLIGIIVGGPKKNKNISYIIPILDVIAFAGMNPLIRRTN